MLSDPVELMDTAFKEYFTGHNEVTTCLYYVVAGLSTFAFVLIASLLFSYSRGDDKYVGTPISNALLFFTVLATLQAVLSNSSDKANTVYMLVINIVIGILLNLYGCVKFFQAPINARPLGYQHSSINVIILAITVPLCLMEMFIAVLSLRSGSRWQSALVFTTMAQKIVQVGIYYFSITHKSPSDGRHRGASWYLKIISLYNFAMWLQSIVEGNSSMDKSLGTLMPDGASVISAVYSALIVDYRLLFVLIYIEISLEIDHWDEEHTESETVEITPGIWNTPLFHVEASQSSGFGYLLGLLVVISQFTVVLQYKKEPDIVGPWINVFGIIADVCVIVPGVFLFLIGRFNREEDTSWCQASSKGVHVMVALMGIVGLLYWFLLASVTCIMAAGIIDTYNIDRRYLIWISATNIVRVVGVLFQLFFYFRIPPLVGLRTEVRGRKLSYTLLPFLVLCQISVFINAVVLSYSSVVEEFLHRAKLNAVMTVAFKVGEPLHLGFCLHMFFHFLICHKNLKKQLQVLKNEFVSETMNEDSDASLVERLLQAAEVRYKTI